MQIEFFFNYMLQNKQEVISEALEGKLPNQIISALLFLCIISLALFGLMIGCSHSFIQGVSSFVKLPILFFTTSLICFPTLYIFLALLGAKISFKGLAQFTLISISIMALILFAFAPVSLFFLLVGSDYQTYKLINVFIMSIAGISGTYLFHKYILYNRTEELDTSTKRRTGGFLNLWLVMFGLIGTNLGFAISPFFRNPAEPFVLFTPKTENFFTHLIGIFF
jgi:hypothetical protein